jgi:hypothetical protein
MKKDEYFIGFTIRFDVKTENKTFFLALHHIPSCPLIFRVAKPGQCCINVAAKKYGLIQKHSKAK